jgi:glycosyltransferase involved in cell wall biosynthesis
VTNLRPRIRVVQLVATGTNGGAQEHVSALLRGLGDARFDMRVIALSDGDAVQRWRETGTPVVVVGGDDDAMVVDRVAGLLTAWRTQILHGHMYRAEVVGARAALRVEALGVSRPWVINHIHSSRRRSDADRARLDGLDHSVDRLVAVSRAIEAKLEDERPHRPPVELIYNGVDLDRFGQASQPCPMPPDLGISPVAPIVGCIGRLEPEKGQATLLRAWPRVTEAMPSAQLLVAGEGSGLNELRTLAASFGPAEPRITFTGHRDDIAAITAALDVSVLPSHREAQGMVIIEAMAAGRPVVASAVGGIPEMIQDGVTGLLVPPDDPIALAAAVIRVLQDAELARRVGHAGQALVRERFDVREMLDRVATLYEDGVAELSRRDDGSMVATTALGSNAA